MTRLYLKIGTEVIITWAVVFGATFHAGMSADAFALMIAAMLVQGGRDVLKELSNPNPNPFPGLPVKPARPPAEPPLSPSASSVAAVVTAFLAMMFLTGCAHTNISAPDGGGKMHVVAHFEGDMQGQSFHYADGKTDITWMCTSVSHSTATLAQGEAAHNVIGGVATLTTSTGLAVATSGMMPGGIGNALHLLLHYP